MERIAAVIGAGYGDEGKGVITDAWAAQEDSPVINIRFNGGAQAGHTVYHQGREMFHEFHHFGAATFRGAATLLAYPFIVNPILFWREWKTLDKDFGKHPMVYADPRCFVTTPWDMYLNNDVERSRGDQRHGSCGIGILETVVRSRQFRLTLGTLWGAASLRQTVDRIGRDYVPGRAAELGIAPPRIDDETLDMWVRDTIQMLDKLRFVETSTFLRAGFNHWQRYLFEGAQGLRLDAENLAEFPHLTPSRTGMTNVRKILIEAGLQTEPVKVFYVTRTYSTRHGAGRLLHEMPGHPYGWAGFEANQINPYQGLFRYGVLDIEGMQRAIDRDRVDTLPGERPCLAVTCLDQVGYGRTRVDPSSVAQVVGLPIGAEADGPSAEWVAFLNDHDERHTDQPQISA